MAKKKRPLKTTVKTIRVKRTEDNPHGSKAKTIQFEKGRKNPERIQETLKDFDYSTFDYLRRKNKPVKGAGYKPPQGFTVIITLQKGKNTYHYTKLTPPDFVVTPSSIKTFVQETTESLMSEYDAATEAIIDAEENEGELLDDERAEYVAGKLNPENITGVTVRFLYGK